MSFNYRNGEKGKNVQNEGFKKNGSYLLVYYVYLFFYRFISLYQRTF